MKLTFKNIKTFMGREGIGLNADIYLNNKKCCFVMDDASGGPFRYNVLNVELFKMLRDYVANISEKCPINLNKESWTDLNLDVFIDKEFARFQKEKQLEKISKKYSDHLIWGKPDGDSYKQVKFSSPFTSISKEVLQLTINKYKNSLEPGEVIWNTNFKDLGIQI